MMLSDGTRTIEKSQSGPCRGHGSAISQQPIKYVNDFKRIDHRYLAVASHRFRTIKIYPKDVAWV
jgi:hypothetical protein